GEENMSTQDNSNVVKQLFNFYNLNNQSQLNSCDGFFSSNAKFHDPAMQSMFNGKTSIQTMKQAESEYIKAFPNKSTKIDTIFASGDNVAVCWTSTATHKGPFQGFPASNKPIKVTGVSIYRFNNGKIEEVWQVW